MLTKTAGKVNQVIYWGRPLDWHNQTLTPNPDTLYFMAFFNTKDVGPVVLEIPPADANGSLNGNIVNVWQMPLEDAGLLGVDKGAGGKFLILPPGYDGPNARWLHRAAVRTPSAAMRCSARTSRAIATPTSPKSIAYGKRIKVYPLSQAANPPATVFTDVKDVDFRFHHPLRRELLRAPRPHRAERALARSRPGDDRSAEVARHREGQAVQPGRATKALLDAGAREAQAWLEAKYDAGLPPFFEGTQPLDPAGAAGTRQGRAGGLCRTRRLPDRCAGHGLQLRLHRHQAARRRPVLPDLDQGQGRRRASTAARPIA